MFTKIVIPFDEGVDSLRAVPVGASVGRKIGVPMVAVTVARSVTDGAAMEATATDWMAKNGFGDVEVSSVVSNFGVVRALASILDEGRPLVVIASETHPHTKTLVGSVSEDLVHESPLRFALVVGPEVSDEYSFDGAILACVDTTGHSDPILGPFSETVHALGVDPWLVTVLDPADIPALTARGIGEPSIAFENNALHNIAMRLEKLGLPNVSYDSLHGGDPAAAILDYIEVVKPSSLMVASRDRGDLSRLVFGSVAMKVVKKAKCPVFVVHREE